MSARKAVVYIVEDDPSEFFLDAALHPAAGMSSFRCTTSGY